VILHAAEDDDAVARRLDLVGEHLKARAKTERSDLALDQPLARLRQRPLRLADADRQRAALGLAGLDQQFTEEMRLAGAAPAVNTFVARGLEQRLKGLGGRDFQGGQRLARIVASEVA